MVFHMFEKRAFPRRNFVAGTAALAAASGKRVPGGAKEAGMDGWNVNAEFLSYDAGNRHRYGVDEKGRGSIEAKADIPDHAQR